MKGEKSCTTLMAFSGDIRKRSFFDWLKAHTSFMKPLHRYDGVFTLERDRMFFNGRDVKTDKDFSIDISKNDVTDVNLGFDEIFKRSEDRGMGIGFVPLRIGFKRNGKEDAIYLITEFNRTKRTSENDLWFERIRKWLG